MYAVIAHIPNLYHTMDLPCNQQPSSKNAFAVNTWKLLTTSLFNVSPYLPHLFNPAMQSVRTADHPVFSVLLKILPQRSQYKFFVRTINQFTKYPDFLYFLKSILFAGYTGLFYPWSKGSGLTLIRMFQIYEFLCVQDTNWDAFVMQNVRIIFFMIKEYVCLFVRMNPAAHTVLKSLHAWKTHEHHIFSCMDHMRCLFNRDTTNPHRQMLLASHKSPYHTASCLYTPQHVTSWDKLKQRLLSSFLNNHNQQAPYLTKHHMQAMSQIYSLKKLHNALMLEALPFLHNIHFHELHNVPTTSTVEAICATNKTLSYTLYVWLLVDFLIAQITFSALPVHHQDFQIRALHHRHDIPITDTERLHRVSHSYFCFTCGKLRSNGFQMQSKPKNHQSYRFALGHAGVTYDPVSKLTMCVGTTRRSRRTASPPLCNLLCGQLPCIQLPLLGQNVTFSNITYSLCYTCGVPTFCTSSTASPSFTASNAQPLPYPQCNACITSTANEQMRPSKFCFLCLRSSNKMTTVRLFNDVDIQLPSPWSFISLCLRHSRPAWNLATIQLKSSLIQRHH